LILKLFVLWLFDEMEIEAEFEEAVDLCKRSIGSFVVEVSVSKGFHVRSFGNLCCSGTGRPSDLTRYPKSLFCGEIRGRPIDHKG